MLSPRKTHPFWRTGTRYNAKGRLGPAGPAGLRSLLLGFNYIIPQPGMALFSRRNIGGTTRKGPKGDRRGPKVSTFISLRFFRSPTTSASLKTPSKGASKGPKGDRRGTEGGPKGDRRGTEGMHSAGVWHIWWACLVS